jgi:hypothetical protein
LDLAIVRIIFLALVSLASYWLQPFDLHPAAAAVAGAVIAGAVIFAESRLRQITLKRLLGAAIGSLLGILGAFLFSLVIHSAIPLGNTERFLQMTVMLLMAYVGLVVGAKRATCWTFPPWAECSARRSRPSAVTRFWIPA